VVGDLGRNPALRVFDPLEEDAELWASPLVNVETLYRKRLLPVKVCSFIGDGLSDYGCVSARETAVRLRLFLEQHRQKREIGTSCSFTTFPRPPVILKDCRPRGARLGFRIDAGHAERIAALHPTGGDFSTTLGLGGNPSSRCGQASRRLNELAGTR